MDTSNPAVFVNADLLRMHVGKRVRAVVQVIRSDAGSVVGKCTGGKQIVVKGHPPAPYGPFLEVIGIADTHQSIRAEFWTNLSESFDAQGYNQICLLANGEFRHLFV